MEQNWKVKVNGWVLPGPGWGEMEQEEKAENYYSFSLSKGECVLHRNREQAAALEVKSQLRDPYDLLLQSRLCLGKHRPGLPRNEFQPYVNPLKTWSLGTKVLTS